MGRMTLQQAQPYTPPGGLALLSGVSAAMWYPLHGSVLAAGGLGVPDLTLTGTVGTIWTANWGSATPDGATHYASAAVGNAALQEIFDLRDISGQQIIIGFELQTDGDLSGSEGVLWWGANSGGVGTTGWGVQINSAEQVSCEFRGLGSSGATTQAVSSTAMSTADRYAVVVSLVGTSASQVTISVNRWLYGTGLQTQQQAAGVDILGTAGTEAPGINGSFALTLLARRGASVYDRFLGATSGSNAKINNVWSARLPVPQAGLPEQCLLAMGAAPREFPRSLRAAS